MCRLAALRQTPQVGPQPLTLVRKIQGITLKTKAAKTHVCCPQTSTTIPPPKCRLPGPIWRLIGAPKSLTLHFICTGFIGTRARSFFYVRSQFRTRVPAFKVTPPMGQRDPLGPRFQVTSDLRVLSNTTHQKNYKHLTFSLSLIHI